MSLLQLIAASGAKTGGSAALSWTAANGLTDGESITFATDGTYSFNGSTAKATAKPLLWWEAGQGQNPTSDGVKTAWDGTFSGSVSTAVVETGSTQSYVYNHGSSSNTSTDFAALGDIIYSSDTCYMWRKVYDDFVIDEDHAIMIRPSNTTGITQGKTITGSSSGATGVVDRLFTAGSNVWVIFQKGQGTIYNVTPTYFTTSESLTWTGGSGTNLTAYGSGTRATFNYKTIRNRSDNAGGINNAYCGGNGIPGEVPGGATADYLYGVYHENSSQSTLEHPSWTNQLVIASKQWRVDEYEHLASTIDTADGRFRFWQNRVVGPPVNQGYQNRTTANSDRYDTFVQLQVSNGTAASTNQYYDAVYFDVSYHRVVISDASTWSNSTEAAIEVLLPTAWNDTSVTAKLRKGSLSQYSGNYVYIFNSNGITPVNTNGVLL
jgi:hypothetical protein